jgi:hypothetical protein
LWLRGGLGDALDVWIGGVKQRRGGWLLLLLLHGIGSVGVFASLDGLDDAQGVVLGVLGLGRDLRVVFLPDAQDIEEGRCSHERVSRGGCDLVLCHILVALPKSLQGKLFAVGARSQVVQQGVFARHVCLGLLQLLHQVGGIGGAFCVGRVQSSTDDLLHDVEAYWWYCQLVQLLCWRLVLRLCLL